MNVSLPPLIVVTDPGEDVDDTFALMLAATSPKFALKAVISANEDLTPEGIGKVACYARKLLNAMGRSDVPVYQGESLGHHALLCSMAPSDIQKQNEHYLPAVEALARSYPKVYLLGIAALSPIAKIAQAEWFSPEKFEIYLMGGKIEKEGEEKPEYNIKKDFKAAQTVFRSRAPIHLITSNSAFQPAMQLVQGSRTHQTFTSLAEQGRPVFRLLQENYQAFLDNYFHKYGYISYLSDALAFSALEESFVTFSGRKIEVLDGGRTVLSEQGEPVMVSSPEVKSERFIDYLIERISQIRYSNHL